MLKDITMQASQPEIKELLNYSVFPDPRRWTRQPHFIRVATAGCSATKRTDFFWESSVLM